MDVSFKDRGLEYGSLYNSMKDAVDRASELTVGHHKDIAKSLKDIRVYTDKMFSALAHHQIKQARHDMAVLDHEKLLIKRNHALMVLLPSSRSLANSTDGLSSSMKALVKSSHRANASVKSQASPSVSAASSKASSIVESAGNKGMSMVASAKSITMSMSSQMNSSVQSVSVAVSASQSVVQSLQSKGVSMSMSLTAMKSNADNGSTQASSGAFGKIRPSSENSNDSNFTSASANHSSNSSKAPNSSNNEGVPPQNPNGQKQSNMPDPFKDVDTKASDKNSAKTKAPSKSRGTHKPPKTPNQMPKHPGEETFHHQKMSIHNPNVGNALKEAAHDSGTPMDRRRAAGSQPDAPSGQPSDTDNQPPKQPDDAGSDTNDSNNQNNVSDTAKQNGGHLSLT